MTFCICQPFSCEDSGLISVSINGSSGVRVIPGTNTLIPGAATGTIGIVGYAFEKGDDKWLGVRCPSSAQGNQNNYVRFDACFGRNGRFVIIPSRANSAILTGDSMSGVSFKRFTQCAPIQSEPAAIQNGVTIAYKTTTQFGYDLRFKFLGFPSLNPLSLFGASPAYSQNLSITSAFPQPAQFNASFQFIVD